VSEFLIIVKKDIREVWRTKRFLLYALIALAMVLFTYMILGIMQIVVNHAEFSGSAGLHAQAMFAMTVDNATGFFMTFMMAYFLIAVVIFTRNIISKEIAENKWTLPLQAGIKPWKLILSKILVYVSAILIAAIIAALLHLVLTVIFCRPEIHSAVTSEQDPRMALSPDGEPFVHIYNIGWAMAIGRMFTNFGHMIVGLLFISVCTLTINAITKKGWVAILVPLLLIIVAPMPFAFINVGDYSLLYYTPFIFFNTVESGQTGGWLEYLISSFITIGIIIALIVWAIRSGKVSGLKNKRSEE